MKYTVQTTIGLPGATVEPGEVLDDSQLEGIDIERLINVGALTVGKQTEATAEAQTGETRELDDMTNKELQQLAKDMGLEVNPRANKATLVELISEAAMQGTAKELGIDTAGMETEAILEAIAQAQEEL